MPQKKKTSDAVEILHRRYYEGKPDRITRLEEARAEDELARKIYELREQAGVTQARLAKLIGTSESVISRFPIRRGSDRPSVWPTGSRRYGRLQTCATRVRFMSSLDLNFFGR